MSIMESKMKRKSSSHCSSKILPKNHSNLNHLMYRHKGSQHISHISAKGSKGASHKPSSLNKKDNKRSISTANPDQNSEGKRSFRCRKSIKSKVEKVGAVINGEPVKDPMRFQKCRMLEKQRLKQQLENIDLNEVLINKKIEENSLRKGEQRYLLERPQTSTDHRHPNPDMKQIFFSSDRQAKAATTHRRRIFQCKLIRCSKTPFPMIEINKAKRKRMASNVEGLNPCFDNISEIYPNLNDIKSFLISPESRDLINF